MHSHVDTGCGVAHDVLPPVGDLVTGQIKKADAKLSTSEESESKTPE